ncbi:MAG: carboxypeptidase-like regulatory domain-containing protein, partial [Candidatus Eisenbacteria bacterium]
MRTIILIALVHLALATAVAAGEGGVKVILSGQEVVETLPRTTFSASVRIVNETSGEIRLIPRIDLPAGWALLTADQDLTLDAGKEMLSLATFLVPEGTPAGRYEIAIGFMAMDDASLRGDARLGVLVAPLANLGIELIEVTGHVVAGEEYRAVFAVTNRGNARVPVHIRAESGQQLPFRLDIERLDLSPRERRMVTVTLGTDRNIRSSLRDLLIVTARSPGDVESEARAKTFVQIIPRISGEGDRFHKLPTGVRVSYVREESPSEKSQFQAEIFGSGTLDESGHKHVDFRFRGPDIRFPKILGQREQYYLRHWTGTYDLFLGDGGYAVSPLMENYRYGRGVRGRLDLHGLRVGGHYMETIWDEPEQRQVSGHLMYLINSANSFGISYLSKETEVEENLLGVGANFAPTSSADLELEYSRGLDIPEDADGYRARLLFSKGPLSYLFRFIRAEPDFPGYYRDMDLYSTSLSLALGSRLSLTGAFQHDRNNLDLDSTFYAAPKTTTWEGRVGFRIRKTARIAAGFRRRSEEDRFAKRRFNYYEDILSSSIGHWSGKWNLYVYSEVGTKTNLLDDRKIHVQRYNGSLNIRPTPGQSYSVYAYFDANSNPGRMKEDHLILGTDADLDLRTGTSLNLGFRSETYQFSRDRDRGVFDAHIGQKLFYGHAISLQGHYVLFSRVQPEDRSAVMVQYTVPIGFPVSRKETVGEVKGRVVEYETGTALSEVIVRLNGYTAVTDRNGQFSFPVAAVGTYHLTLDRASIGFDKVTMQRSPLETDVEAGRSRHIDLQVV